MQVNCTFPTRPPKPEPIASWKHLAGFLAIMAVLLVLGLYQQHAGGGSGAGSNRGSSPATPMRSRSISRLS